MEIPTESARAIIRASRNQSSDTMLDASCKELLRNKFSESRSENTLY